MISLGFRNFGTLTSNSSPHLSRILVMSKFVSSVLPTSIRSHQSFNDLRDLIHIFISVGLILVFRTFLIVSGD